MDNSPLQNRTKIIVWYHHTIHTTTYFFLFIMAVGRQIRVLMFSNYIKKSCTVKDTFGIQKNKFISILLDKLFIPWKNFSYRLLCNPGLSFTCIDLCDSHYHCYLFGFLSHCLQIWYSVQYFPMNNFYQIIREYLTLAVKFID